MPNRIPKPKTAACYVRAARKCRTVSPRRTDVACGRKPLGSARGCSIFGMELPTERRMIEAGRINAANPIALADCFVISCAADNDAVLYTGDPEILSLPGLPCQFRDLRS